MTPAEEIEVPTLYDRALTLATVAHSRQFDHTGRPYVEHPMWVAAQSIKNIPHFEWWKGVVIDPGQAAVIGVLHDTIEDTWVTAEILDELFPPQVSRDVTVLSQPETPKGRKGRNLYLSGILTATSPYPLLVKISDLQHNTSVMRLDQVAGKDLEKATWLRQKYYLDAEYLGLLEDDCPFAPDFAHLRAWAPKVEVPS